MEEEYEVTEKMIRRLCDVCKAPAQHSCDFCLKDLCGWRGKGCAIIDPYDDGGDYPNYFCKECLKKGKRFMKIIDDCQKKENKAIEDWKGLCKKQEKETTSHGNRN